MMALPMSETAMVAHGPALGSGIAQVHPAPVLRHRRKMLATVDGELRYFKSPITITIEPGALKMLMPAASVGGVAAPQPVIV